MNRLFSLLAIICLLAGSVSCKNKKSSNKPSLSTESVQSKETGIDELLAPAGEPQMLCSQELTSFVSMLDAFENGRAGDYLHEPTEASKAFFSKDPDIKTTDLMKKVRLRHNYCAVMNRVLHGYEWFGRVSSAGDDESTVSRKDTLRWIRESQPMLTDAMIAGALDDGKALDAARRLVNAYKRFDGDDGEDSPFAQAFRNLNEVFGSLPAIVTEEELDTFEKEFWGWYDKEQFVPGISKLIKMNMRGYEGPELSEEQLEQFIEKLKQRVLSEKDIDRRAILALELVKFSPMYGSVYLGDIIESGIYTRYLLEVWISWRASVQDYHSPSSFSVIPNNYYDMLRVVCLNTFLRHCQSEDDFRARCLMDNLILCEIVHRMGSLAGNSSFLTRMHLAYDMFIHPDLLPKEK